jgi:hypothetical protein
MESSPHPSRDFSAFCKRPSHCFDRCGELLRKASAGGNLMQTTDEYMNAVRVHRRGGPEALVYEQAPRPRPRDGEVPVRVHAAAITPAEFSWLGNITTPINPSHEMSGVVAGIGSRVSGVAVGDEVYGWPAFLNARRYCSRRARHLLHCRAESPASGPNRQTGRRITAANRIESLSTGSGARRLRARSAWPHARQNRSAR